LSEGPVADTLYPSGYHDLSRNNLLRFGLFHSGIITTPTAKRKLPDGGRGKKAPSHGIRACLQAWGGRVKWRSRGGRVQWMSERLVDRG
jgi:hypothetical protein